MSAFNLARVKHRGLKSVKMLWGERREGGRLLVAVAPVPGAVPHAIREARAGRPGALGTGTIGVLSPTADMSSSGSADGQKRRLSGECRL